MGVGGNRRETNKIQTALKRSRSQPLQSDRLVLKRKRDTENKSGRVRTQNSVYHNQLETLRINPPTQQPLSNANCETSFAWKNRQTHISYETKSATDVA